MSQVPGMSFDAARLEARRKTLGASEIAAVAGIDPYRGALAVWAEKRGLVPSFEGNEFTEWGLRNEDAIAKKYGEAMHVAFEQSETMIHPAEPWVSATPDRIVVSADGRWGLEIKNKSEYSADKWGPTGTDRVPNEVAAQCHWSMLVTGLPWWDVAVLLGGNQYRQYRLHADAEIGNTLLERGREFWFNYVVPGVEPPVDGTKASADHLARKFATHTEVVREATLDEVALIDQLAELKGLIKQTEEKKSAVENTLKAAIGDAAGVTTPRGDKITWKVVGNGRTSWSKVAAEANVPQAIIAKHTSEPQRELRAYLKGTK